MLCPDAPAPLSPPRQDVRAKLCGQPSGVVAWSGLLHSLVVMWQRTTWDDYTHGTQHPIPCFAFYVARRSSSSRKRFFRRAKKNVGKEKRKRETVYYVFAGSTSSGCFFPLPLLLLYQMGLHCSVVVPAKNGRELNSPPDQNTLAAKQCSTGPGLYPPLM